MSVTERPRMRLVAGMGSLDDYLDFCDAGADELFIGFVPEDWQVRHGLMVPLNRREVCYYNVQLGACSELAILASMVRRRGVPVTIAMNGLCYQPGQYQEIAAIMEKCAGLGFDRFIVADPALLCHLAGTGAEYHLQVSGEMGEVNRYAMAEWQALGAERVIFRRRVAPEDMATMIRAVPEMEYEAFLLNEACQFHGAYCNSLHCDELPPMCRVPYELGTVAGERLPLAGRETVDDVVGAGGCGLCAMHAMRAAGVTHLKIVGRGAGSDGMLRSLRTARRALDLLDTAGSEAAFQTAIRHELFPHGCSGDCYYR